MRFPAPRESGINRPSISGSAKEISRAQQCTRNLDANRLGRHGGWSPGLSATGYAGGEENAQVLRQVAMGAAREKPHLARRDQKHAYETLPIARA
jgi:hypothetical protein